MGQVIRHVPVYTTITLVLLKKGDTAQLTANQLSYLNLKETERANLARETEANRSNRVNEEERARSNRANEAETQRSNVARETETNRHNVVGETEENRHNVRGERLQIWHNINESVQTAGKVSDAVRSWVKSATNSAK